MKNLIFYSVLFFSLAISAQEKDKAMDEANEQYLQKQFVDAESNYRISNSKIFKFVFSFISFNWYLILFLF
jgi:hypothetical protein